MKVSFKKKKKKKNFKKKKKPEKYKTNIAKEYKNEEQYHD